MKLEITRENYKSELIRKIEEKLSILFNNYHLTECGIIVLDFHFTCKTIQGNICKVEKVDNKFIVNVDYQEYITDYVDLSDLDITTLEYHAFNAFSGYEDLTNNKFVFFPKEMIV